ncbi:HAD family hydrolase [Microbacterium oryzae]|uniref:HAD family hydrolase n=1 Tax=Microbacterium oryzae TaxID=743009 RepID=UPI0025B012E1|nr:HAD family hydrolase [Microbacterium oryzae]MDN3310301.1 HAD family hydrolase [Microbacterium oryzae]
MRPSIIFDFDGTLAVGSGPVRAYAQLVALTARAGYLQRVEAALRAFEDGDTTYRDGYDVVGSLAADDGVDGAAMSAAYHGSRDLLGSPLAPVSAMPDLPGFLERLSGHARLVLATNAPEAGVERVLQAWGVRDRFDAVHATVGKPAGLAAVIRALLEDGPVLAVGDIFDFDLAPAQALGADTALVGATAATSRASVTMRGADLGHIRGDIETWAATAASRNPAPEGADPLIER